jgi:tRNA 2-thiouridine synthesizing protein A
MTVEGSASVEMLSSLAVDSVVDARGTSCPGPILAAKKGMPKVTVGEVMEVLATDKATLRDLPAWCKKMNHEYLGFIEEPGFWKLYVRRSR